MGTDAKSSTGADSRATADLRTRADPSPTPFLEPACPWEAQMTACASQGGVFECKRCAEEVAGDPCCSCIPSTHTVTSATVTETHTTDTSSSTILATRTTTTSSTTAAVAGNCKPWCGDSEKPWS